MQLKAQTKASKWTFELICLISLANHSISRKKVQQILKINSIVEEKDGCGFVNVTQNRQGLCLSYQISKNLKKLRQYGPTV